MYQLILLVHVIISVAIIGLVLIQQGKGSYIGASFGSGASQTVFGSQGSGSFLMKFTGVLAAGFFTTSLLLGYLASYEARQTQDVSITAPVTVPVQDKRDEK